MISGARYSSVPTKELARASGSATSKYVEGSSELYRQHQNQHQAHTPEEAIHQMVTWELAIPAEYHAYRACRVQMRQIDTNLNAEIHGEGIQQHTAHL